MASKILANDGGKMMDARLKQARSAFGGFLVWLVIAILFPYPILRSYWAEGEHWGPVVLYLLAFFNLLRGIWYAGQAVRFRRPNPSAGRPARTASAKASTASRADIADRANRADERAAKDQRRNAALPQIRRPPTVQRTR